MSTMSEPAPKRDHLSLINVALETGDAYDDEEGPWRCDACGAVGSFDALSESDCPKGLAPAYPKGEPEYVDLCEVAYGEHLTKVYRVHRFEVYERDSNYDLAKTLRTLPGGEAALRLGAVSGVWEFHSAIDGGYVGDEDRVLLLQARGIAPQLINSDKRVCSIGFSAREQAWYGWSHRAIFGFRIGHVVAEGDSGSTVGEDDAVPVGFECKTLDDCKRCAIAFARSVS